MTFENMKNKKTTVEKNTTQNIRYLVTTFLFFQLCASTSLAQFDDFPPPPPAINENDFIPPAPTQAAPGFNGGSAGSAPTSLDSLLDGENPANFPTNPAPSPGSQLGRGSQDNQGSQQSVTIKSTGNTIVSPVKGSKSSILSDKQKKRFAKANPEDITSENFPETIESFDFPNVEITDIIKAISELTGKNFIIDSTVRGKITIIAPSKITVAEAYKAFLSSLAINGFTVVPNGGFLKIRNARSAQRDGIDIYSGSYYPNTDQMITKVVHLKHITAETLKTQLGRLLNSSYGEIEAYPQTNSMIISDFGSSIDRIMKIINQLDVPGFEEQLEVVGIKYAKAKDISELIDKIVNKGQKGQSSGGGFGGGRFSAAPTGGVASKSGGTSSFLVFPDDRTNSLIIVGNRAGIARVKKLVGQLDFKVSAESQGGVFVYYVKHGEAEKIAQTLSEVAKESAPKAPVNNGGFGFQPQGQAAVREGVFGGDVSIKADKGTNSLVISASKQDYEKVMNILTKLDIPRDQVFVEAIVMEMNMTDGFESSGGLVKFNKDGGKAGFAGKGQDLVDFLSPLGGAGKAILGFSSGSIDVTDPTKGTTSKVPNLLGYLKFIKQFGKTNILSTPQITAMDAQEAEIDVGDAVVTRATVVQGANGTGNSIQPEFTDANIKLKIKPFISPSSEMIRLEYTQQIKQISNVKVPSSFEGQVTPLSSRNMKTNLVLNNGDTAVIGGLMKDEEKETTNKVPVLGDLPILGWLFKSKEVSKTKVNMLVFLTPRIIRNQFDQNRLVLEKTNERLEFLKKNSGKDPYGSTIDKILKRGARTKKNNNDDLELK